jgi:hypothetical protein
MFNPLFSHNRQARPSIRSGRGSCRGVLQNSLLADGVGSRIPFGNNGITGGISLRGRGRGGPIFGEIGDFDLLARRHSCSDNLLERNLNGIRHEGPRFGRGNTFDFGYGGESIMCENERKKSQRYAHRQQHAQHNRSEAYGLECQNCGGYESESDANGPKKPLRTTSDVVLRGTNYSLRKNFLMENPKFEVALVKYVDKKGETALPDHILEMVCEFTNDDDYSSETCADDVSVYLLAQNCSSASLSKHAMWRLKHGMQRGDAMKDVVQITVNVLLSSDAKPELKLWLKDYLKARFGQPLRVCQQFQSSRLWLEAVEDHPELHLEILVLMDLQARPKSVQHL